MKELNNAELLEVSGGADFSYSYKELAEAMTTGGAGHEHTLTAIHPKKTLAR
ncbi:hypothetical protein [Photorhabdus bodei]|uniref:Bacteriocin n=1 Tax=Photorhabdus bodei TaxID=2029681 RepID=A0AAW6BNG5_9GAMM|nr:hypothetical protein [Photorhabdus bodei]MDB6374983.1 hypothetical protein [Photorhabdus bodei]